MANNNRSRAGQKPIQILPGKGVSIEAQPGSPRVVGIETLKPGDAAKQIVDILGKMEHEGKLEALAVILPEVYRSIQSSIQYHDEELCRHQKARDVFRQITTGQTEGNLGKPGF